MPATDQVVVPTATPDPPRLFDHAICTTPKASEDVPVSEAVVPGVDRLPGCVIATVGATLSVTVTARLSVVLLPAASRAVTVMTLAPCFRAIVPADQLVPPVATPEPPWLFAQRTSVTATLSVAAPASSSVGLLVANVDDVVGCAM